MSDISEDGWAAGWMDGLEYALWYMVLHGPAQYGFKFVDKQTILQLRYFSEQARCWIMFDDAIGEVAISFPDWETMFQKADPASFYLGMPNL
ncbi:hypothetical protein [Hymenobacter sp. IS2118]|uniref:hypothetical protein n=1 Tax=Hymenobacter sp. IS2118 TaxID=1505605 RepID=UPI0005565276|nr:hypothetical protein [Hymenobacter sp. IS2118]